MGILAMQGADNLAAYYPPSGDYPSYSGTAIWIGQIQDLTFDQNEGRTVVRYLGGGIGDRNLDYFIDKTADYSGRIRYYPQDGKLWTFVIGSVSTAGGSVFTISESGGRIYWGGLELHNGNPNDAGSGLLRKLYGVNFDSMTISSTEGEAVECEIEFFCGSVANTVNSAAPTLTASTAVPYMWDDVQMAISGAAWNDTLHSIKEFNFSINNNMEHPFYLDYTRFKGESIPAAREYSLDLTMNLIKGTGADLYDKFYYGGSSFNMNIFLFRTSGTDQVNIALSGCKMTAMEIPMAMEGPVEQTCTITPESCAIIIADSSSPTYPDWSLAK